MPPPPFYCSAAAVETPNEGTAVLLVVPDRSERAGLAVLRQRLAAAPTDVDTATRLARAYLRLASQTGDPRYSGYARAALSPWREEHAAPPDVLLLPPALAGSDGGRAVSLRIVKVVTAFTVAHSITLSLAVLGYVDLPARFVEAVIAASIVIAALGNLVPSWRHMGWLLAFGFGLVHGLGFASVLGELGLPAAALWPALLAFNVGVEIGQLAVVAAVLPVLLTLRQRDGLRRLALPSGSLTAAAVGGFWLVERLA